MTRWTYAAVGGLSLILVVTAVVWISRDVPPETERPVDPDEVYDPIVAGEPFPGGIKWVVSRDGIPPIYQPQFDAAASTRLDADDLVIGVTVGDVARAYPVGLLASREIVNDWIDDRPIVVSWCPLCGSGAVHLRELDGDPVLFGNQGALWRNAMTWWDHQTGSIWSQPLGRAIAGPHEGRTLQLLPSTLTTWAGWSTAYPNSTVLRGPILPSGPNDLDTSVVVDLNGETVAYPLPLLRELGIIDDEVGGVPIVIVMDEAGLWSVISADSQSDPVVVATSTIFPDDFPTLWPEGRIYSAG